MDAGIHQLTMAEYLRLDALSSGVAHTILAASPAHARYQQLNPKPANDGMDIGTLAHACLLEGGTDNVRVFNPADFPNVNGKGFATGWTNKAIREAREEARKAGEIPMLKDDYDDVRAMVHTALDFIAGSEIRGVFDTGLPEVSLVWTETCDAGEILCKARADHLTADRRICLSYKTTAGSANPDVWIRTQLPSYDMATVFYERAVLAACEVEETQCVHLIQEQSAPFACSLVALSPALTDLADRKLERAMAIWAECQASGKYPAYPTRICYAEPKPWQFGEWDEQEDNRARLSADELKGGIPA